MPNSVSTKGGAVGELTKLPSCSWCDLISSHGKLRIFVTESWVFIKDWALWMGLICYLRTSSVTCCLAIAMQAFSYILTFWRPIPQKMPKASTKFSSFLVKGSSSNLLTNWNKPKTLLGLLQCMIGMHKMLLCLKSLFLSTWKKIESGKIHMQEKRIKVG